MYTPCQYEAGFFFFTGNTCYLNAVLQNLLSFTPFFETLGKLRIQMRDSDSDHWSKLEGGRLLMRTLLELRKAKLKKSNVKTSLALGQFVDAYKAVSIGLH